MFLFSVLLVISLISVFSNVLFYTISLLLISILVLTWIVFSNCISTLILLLIVVVYVGAIIVLIGYICAVCPNFSLSPSYEQLYLLVVTSLFYFIFYNQFHSSVELSNTGTLLDYFFSNWGLPVFIIIAFMLFLTLIIVTSQYSSPQGPFRSL